MLEMLPKSPEPPLALAVPLSRFTPRVGGGSAFFVGGKRMHAVLTKRIEIPWKSLAKGVGSWLSLPQWLGWLLIFPCVLTACLVGMIEIRVFFPADYANVDVPLVQMLHPEVYAAFAGQLAANIGTGWWFFHPHIFAIYTCCVLIAIRRMGRPDWIKSAQVCVGFMSLAILVVAVFTGLVGRLFPISGR